MGNEFDQTYNERPKIAEFIPFMKISIVLARMMKL